MANQEHVDLLRQGVVIWNQWRRRREHVRPDLSCVNLSGIDLSFVNLFGADLSGADLSGADLSYGNSRK